MTKTLLHVGCGPATIESLKWLTVPVKVFVDDEPIIEQRPMFEGWDERRLDIDDEYSPDIEGNVCEPAYWRWRTPWEGGAFDAVFTSHMLEHLHPFDVFKALRVFRRVVKPDGFVVIIVPNYRTVFERLAAGRIEKLYDSPAGPIYPHDVLFGKEEWTHTNVNQHHRCAMTPEFLRGLLLGAGLQLAQYNEDPQNLIAFCRVIPPENA